MTASYAYNSRELISHDQAFLHYDGFGSTDRVTDANQTVRNHYLYRAFGQVTEISTGQTFLPNRNKWLGRIGYYHQPDSEDYWVRARIYNPVNGRWVSRDPLESEVNLYAYVGNRTPAIVDPDGLQCGPPRLPWADPYALREWMEGELSRRMREQLAAELRAAARWVRALGRYLVCWLGCMNPFSTGAQEMVQRAAEKEASRLEQAAKAAEEAHVRARGLICPGRSSIVRSFRGFARVGRLGKIGVRGLGWIGWGILVWDAYKCHKKCRHEFE